MILPIRPEAPEHSTKLVRSTGRHIASSNPAGNAKTSLAMRVSHEELSFRVSSDDGNLIVAIVAILAGAAVVIAFIIS